MPTAGASLLAAGPRGLNNGHASTRVVVLGLAKMLFLMLANTPFVRASPIVRRSLNMFEEPGEGKSPDDPGMWAYLGVSVALVLLGGVFAGLTIALMGQDEIYLQVISTSGEGAERRNAKRVLRLLKKGKHWVLVTLLLSNVITNETLPIVLDHSLGGGWPAVLSSTVLIVIFGEIVPQSICVRYGLPIGAWCSPFVLALMWIMAPVAWPTAKLLDKLLGEDHGTTYKKAGLKTLVGLHKTLGHSPDERLNEDEVTIISAVLDLKDKPVGSIMTPMNDVFTLSADAVLDENMMDTILLAGYSRIPIYAPDNPRNFLGMLLVKMLITYDPEDSLRVRDFSLATLPETRPETSCLDIVNFFQEGKSHMVLVSDFPGEPYGALGVVTLEDVIEELIGEEIIDESDVFVDVHKAIRRMAPAPWYRVPKGEVVTDASNKVQAQNAGEDPTNQIDVEGNGSRKQSSVDFGTSPRATTFLMRRRSSGTGNDSPSNRPVSVPLRGNNAEIKQHLKHLGPSNAASRPKATRIGTVKIKPGVGTIPEGVPTDHAQEHIEEEEEAEPQEHPSIISRHAPDGGVGDRLLSSAGRIASDGVHAVAQGYGSFGTSPVLRQDVSENQANAMNEESSKPSSKNGFSNGSSFYQRGVNLVMGRNGSQSDSPPHSTVGSLRSRSPSPGVKLRMTARSGSISENVIERGGFKKMVLEPTSSSSDADEHQIGHAVQSLANDRNGGDEASESTTTGKKKQRKKRAGKKKKAKDGAKDEGGASEERSPLLGSR